MRQMIYIILIEVLKPILNPREPLIHLRHPMIYLIDRKHDVPLRKKENPYNQRDERRPKRLLVLPFHECVPLRGFRLTADKGYYIQ